MAFKTDKFKLTHYFFSSKLRYSSSAAETADSIVTIFTTKGPSAPELTNFSPSLTPHLVESVLTRLRSWRVAHNFFHWASNQHPYHHTSFTFNAIASILSRSHQTKPLVDLAKHLPNSSCSFTPGAFSFFLRCLGNLRLAQEAHHLFDEMSLKGLCVPDRLCYNALLEVISKSGSLHLMEMRLNEMKGFGWEFDKYTLMPILVTYCNAGRFDQALSVYKEMEEKGWVDDRVCSMMAVYFSKLGKVDKAFEMVERMGEHGMKLTEKTFCALIHGFVKESRVDKGLQMFDKMRRENGFTPDVSLYNVLIGGLCKINDSDGALSLLSEMKESGVKPDIGIYTKLISSFSDDIGMLSKLLKEILEREEDEKTLVLIYNALLTCYVNDGSMGEAYRLIQMMIHSKSSTEDDDASRMYAFSKVTERLVSPNITSFSIVIDGSLKNDQLDLALSLFNDMRKIAGKPTISIYNNLIDSLCKSNRLEESYELLREMRELGVEPTHFTYNSLYGCMCKRKDVSGACDMLKEMGARGHGPWIKHTTLLVKELCNHGRVMEACEFLDNMVQQGFLPDIVSYSAAIAGLVNIQEVDGAMKIFRDLCSRGHCPDVVCFNVLIRGLCKADRLAEAGILFDELVERGLSPSVVTYNMFIDSWCKNGSVDKAMALLFRMCEEDKEPNVITYTTLVDGLCKAERPDDALLLWKEMEKKGCPPNRIAFMALIYGLCSCCRPTEALCYLREMEQKEMKPDSFIYIALLSAYLSDLNLTSAFEIFKEMVDLELFPNPLDKNYPIAVDAIQKFCKDHRTSSAIQGLMEEGKIPTHTELLEVKD
ncbi:putative pentatricopeptide repeat-containing protein At5g08310, mitochondrial [Vicia villosa]|uniref:putative pentatricopeptide repeat-containing protein At5g08310, mitochondrial n=1 Tax=Vicia villosa TaxID=3911 RepID=UPI00273C6870|nr:putative pentatricopeptide repeat-containing protein At5g08310, mitochondrial [Vicia villosa]